MRIKLALSLVALALILVGANSVIAHSAIAPAAASQAAMGTAFTYQGQIESSGGAITGTCDMQFALYDAASSGSQIGVTQTSNSVNVTNDLFTVSLDFGSSAFNGDARWLEMAVRCPAGSGSYTPLTPRQALAPAPYALALPGLYTQQNVTSTNVIGGYTGNSVTSGVVGAVIGGGGDSTSLNHVTDSYGFVGGGAGNLAGNGNSVITDAIYSTISGGYGNATRGSYSAIGGGYGNTASGESAVVSGGMNNSATGGGASVGGGFWNLANDYWATVGGGFTNAAQSYGATVGGGENNSASGPRATVSGGQLNVASGGASTISGGNGHTASGTQATVGGGYSNMASGDYATVPGGGGAAAPLYGQMAYASGVFAVRGDAQTSTYLLRGTTPQAVPAELFLNGINQRLTIDISRTLTFDILVVARSDAGASAGYEMKGVVENNGGTTSFIGTPTVTTLGEDTAAWNAIVVADDTNDALVVQVTGAVSTTIRWVATVHTTEVAW